MKIIHETWESAFARAEQLRKNHGIWPGIITLAGGGYRLTYDPGDIIR